MTGALDRSFEDFLIIVRYSGDPSRQNLAPLSNELLQSLGIFIIDCIGFRCDKRTCLFLSRKWGRGVSNWLLLPLLALSILLE